MIDIERHVKGYKFGTRCLDYYISQGCASGCSFCSEPVFCGRRWSGLLPEKVVMELEHLAKTYNIDTFMIRDSDFFLNVKRVKALCELLIEKDMGIRLTSVNARMEHFSRIDDSTISLCRKAGVREIFFGFESGMRGSGRYEQSFKGQPDKGVHREMHKARYRYPRFVHGWDTRNRR